MDNSSNSHFMSKSNPTHNNPNKHSYSKTFNPNYHPTINDKQQGNTSITDSDTSDPIYTENPNSPPQFDTINKINQNIIQSNLHTINTGSSLVKNNRIENENNLLHTEWATLQEALRAKDTVINEFQSWSYITQEKLLQFEEKIFALKQQNERLQAKINQSEDMLKAQKKLTENIETNAKGARMYQEHISELEHDFKEKEIKISEKYMEKEEQIKREFLTEIREVTKARDDWKIDNEQLKYQISTLKIEIEGLHSKIEDMNYEYNLRESKHNKEAFTLKEEIANKDTLISTLDKDYRKEIADKDQEISNWREMNSNIMNESNDKNDQINELKTQIESITLSIEMLNNDINEYKHTILNKDTIIAQLRHHKEELIKEIGIRDNELRSTEQNYKLEENEYTQQMNQWVKEKNELENQNMELVDSWSIANESLKKWNDLITDKYSSIEAALYKEKMKNDNMEKKYKNIIKQLKGKEMKIVDENFSWKQIINNAAVMNLNINDQYPNEVLEVSKMNNFNGLNTGNSVNRDDKMFEINNSDIWIRNASGYGGSSHNYTHREENYTPRNANFTSEYNEMSNYNFVYDDPKEESQKKTLEDFKQWWNKIDEKIDIPYTNI